MAAHRDKKPRREAPKQTEPVPGSAHLRGSGSPVSVSVTADEVNGELRYYIQHIGQWLATQDVVAAEVMLVLGALMEGVLKDTWPTPAARPEQVTGFMKELDALGRILTGMVVLHRLEPEALWSDLGHS